MIPAAPAISIDAFANQRKWREFVAAVQCPVDYSAVISTLRSGSRLFYDGIVRVSTLSSKR
jgi:hypothetical protein